MADQVLAKSGSEVLSLILELMPLDKDGDPYAFRLDRHQYRVREADGTSEAATLNWDQALVADLKAVQKPSADPVVKQRLGETLRRFLQPAGWIEHELQIQQAVKEQRRVVLTLRSEAAELYSLPWELITLKGSGQHLAELKDVLVRYEWPGANNIPELSSPASGGRILMCWSAVAGEVPADEHIAAIKKACEHSPHSFDPTRDVLADASVGKLDEILAAAQRSGPPISVLHILCHGSPIGQTFGLALNGEDSGSGVVVDAGRLRGILAPYANMVRLVVLSACDSGNSGALGNQLGSVAQTLHQVGFANVVASRYPLSVDGSVRLTQVLYRELFSERGSLEQAVLAARHNLARDDAEQLDWVSLQFYARAADPTFSWPRYLRGPEPTVPAIAQPANNTEKPPTSQSDSARETIKLAISRKMLLIGAAVVGSLLVAGILANALWPDDPDEGPIVLENGKCLNLEQSDFESRRDGGEVNQWVCQGEANQLWYRNGRQIVSHNGLCLEVSVPDYRAGTNGGRIQVGVCHPNMDNQQWQDNKKELRTYNNKCLAIEIHDFESGKQGGVAQQWECTGKPNQSFSDGHRSR